MPKNKATLDDDKVKCTKKVKFLKSEDASSEESETEPTTSPIEFEENSEEDLDDDTNGVEENSDDESDEVDSEEDDDDSGDSEQATKQYREEIKKNYAEMKKIYDQVIREEEAEKERKSKNSHSNTSKPSTSATKNEEISAEFGAYDPIEEDFHGIVCLMKNLWLKEEINISELVDLFISKSVIVFVLKQEEEEEDYETSEKKPEVAHCSKEDPEEEIDDHVYGISSFIPASFASKPCIASIINVISKRVPKDHQIRQVISKPVWALVVNERFVNLPAKIAVPCYQQMKQEMKERKFNCEYILMVCKVLKGNNNEVRYLNAEDELFDESAEAVHEYSVANQSDSRVFDWNDEKKIFEPYRKILLLKRKKWLQIIDSLEGEI